MTWKPSERVLQLQALRAGKMPSKPFGKASKPDNPGKEGKETKKKAPRKSPRKAKKTPIRKVAKKRAAQNKAYTPIRRQFLKDHQRCEAELPGCTGKSEEVHHSDGRTNDKLLKVEDFRAVCRSCHRVIHDKLSKEKAKKLGMKK